MRITNTIGWQTSWLSKVIRFCCRELEYRVASIEGATFRLAHKRQYGGAAYLDSHSIRVNINPLNVYPLQMPRQRGLPELMLADAVELLVDITAHEIAHLERWDRFAREWRWLRKRDTAKERDTQRLALRVLAAFRRDRTRLLAAWGESGPGPVRPAVTHRHSCRGCGYTSDAARRPADPYHYACMKCFPSWKAASSAGEFLAYERIREQPASKASPRR